MFSIELIYTNIEATTQDELFDFLCECLHKYDLVHDNYKDKIKEREQQFPTGIPLNQIGVAIPHADAEYAKGDAFVVLTSKQGIPFRNMEDGTDIIAHIIIALVFNDKNKHLENLQNLSALLQNEELLMKISQCNHSEEIYKLIKQ